MRFSPRFTAWMATSPCRTNSEDGASVPVASFTLTMVSLVSVLGIGTPCADLVGLPSQTDGAQWACPRNTTEEIVEPFASLALPREARRSRPPRLRPCSCLGGPWFSKLTGYLAAAPLAGVMEDLAASGGRILVNVETTASALHLAVPAVAVQAQLLHARQGWTVLVSCGRGDELQAEEWLEGLGAVEVERVGARDPAVLRTAIWCL